MIALPRSTPSARVGFLSALQTGLTAPVSHLALWAGRRHQRRALQGMSDQMLKDIGLSRSDAYAEAEKPFWQD